MAATLFLCNNTVRTSTGTTDPATTGRVNVRDLRDRRHFQTRGWLTLAAAPHVT